MGTKQYSQSGANPISARSRKMKDGVRIFGIPYDDRQMFRQLMYPDYHPDGNDDHVKTKAKNKHCLDHLVIS